MLRRNRTLSCLAVSAGVVGGSLSAAAPARASSPLMCTESADQARCDQLSLTLIRLMEAVSPGSAGALAEELLIGYRINGTTTVQCELRVSCDVWPVAIEAARSSTQAGCPTFDIDLCRALAMGLTEEYSAQSVPLVNAIAGHISITYPPDRLPALGEMVADILSKLPSVDGQSIGDTVVALVYLAVTLPPAGSPGAALPDDAKTVGAELLDSEDSEDLAIVSGLDDSTGLPVSTVTKRTQRCRFSFRLYASLETESASWDQVEVFGFAGIVDMRWTDLNESHTRCVRPVAEFTGSLFLEAISNAGSFIASKTKRSPLEQASEELYLGGPPAAVDVHWVTDKVEVEYNFPVQFVIHNYSPPIGNFKSTGVANVKIRGGYYIKPARSTEKDFRYFCDKQGNDASRCRYEEE